MCCPKTTIVGFVLAFLLGVMATNAQAEIYRCVRDGEITIANRRVSGARCALYVMRFPAAKPRPRKASESQTDTASKPSETERTTAVDIDDPVSPKTTHRMSRDELEPILRQAAEEHGIPVPLLRAVITVESGFNGNAVSPVGAQGLMQIMPATGKALDLEDPFDPEQNVMAGARYLRMLSDRFNGDIERTIAAYFSGPTRVARYGGIPSESCLMYVQKVQRLYAQFAAQDAPSTGID